MIQQIGRQQAKLGWMVLLAVLVLLLIRHWPLGPKIAVDFIRFNDWSDFLLEAGFNYRDYWAMIGRPERLYTVTISIMAALKVLFDDNWTFVYFGLNLVWTGLLLGMLCHSARMLGVSWLAIAALLPLVLLSADFMYWPHYVLSDTFFAFLLMTAVWWLVFTLTRQTPRWWMQTPLFLVALVLIGLVAFSRPTSAPYAGSLLLFVLLLPFALERWRPVWVGLGLTFAVLLLAIGYGVLIQTYLETDLLGRSRELGNIAAFAHEGRVVWDRPETAVDHVGGWLGYAQVFLVRFLTFWSPYAESFSLEHLIANGAITLVFLSALVAWLAGGGGDGVAARRIALLVVGMSCAAAVFHSVVFIDYDWRYRFPVIGPLLLLSMLMLNRVGRRLLPVSGGRVGHDWS